MSVKYTQDHEWIKVDGLMGTIGISTYAAGQLGDVVYVELPEVGKSLNQGDEAAIVESVKAASEVYAPISGTVSEINNALENAPETVNQAAQDDGWFLKITITDMSELDGLMDETAYKAYCEDL